MPLKRKPEMPFYNLKFYDTIYLKFYMFFFMVVIKFRIGFMKIVLFKIFILQYVTMIMPMVPSYTHTEVHLQIFSCKIHTLLHQCKKL